MRNLKIVFAVIIFLLALFLLLNLIGISDFSFVEILAYISIISGITLWYFSYTEPNKGGIFAGCFIFLSGIVLAIESSFIIWNPLRMVFPSIFIISGISLFFVYLSEKKKIIFLVLAVLLLAAGMFYLFDRINFKFLVFIEAIWQIILRLWFVIILIALIIYIISGKNNRQNIYTNQE
ncbi:MAG: hypothetical protein N3D80_00485 [Ignavibacterium album]|uniref:DUF5668 domain-containing protein n=1 Tax=Ignavibacterium album TaxID=591197 RepID=A0A7V2ZMD6_9BACT|nr:hypothetical protein [Ignavibacterium album]MCX8104332.1 hypothetical protein [Ignavibacterium album]